MAKEKKEERKQKSKENKRKNILNACSCCRIKKIRCSGGAPCICCTRNGLMCLYPPAKKRGPKNRQKNLLHNDISRVQKNDTINNLTERINNAENMLVDLNKVSDELTDKSRETFVQSFDKLSLSVTTTTDVYEPSNLLFSNFQETDNNNYINLQYGNSTNPIGRGIVFAEDPLHYFSQDVSHFYQSNNMILPSHNQSAFEGQSYGLPNFFEDNTPLSEVYSTLITEESPLTEEF